MQMYARLLKYSYRFLLYQTKVYFFKLNLKKKSLLETTNRTGPPHFRPPALLSLHQALALLRETHNTSVTVIRNAGIKNLLPPGDCTVIELPDSRCLANSTGCVCRSSLAMIALEKSPKNVYNSADSEMRVNSKFPPNRVIRKC